MSVDLKCDVLGLCVFVKHKPTRIWRSNGLNFVLMGGTNMLQPANSSNIKSMHKHISLHSSGESLLKRSSLYSCSTTIPFVVWSSTVHSNVNLLIDDTYR